MPRRVFIAITLPEETKRELSSYQKNWPTLPCRWLKKETFHITLAFLGYLNDNELEEVLNITKEVALRHNPFLVSLKRVAYGPKKEIPPRLVQAEGERSPGFSNLKKDLDNSLAQKIGFSPGKREFLPHITLGRIKKWEWRKIEPEERPEVELNISLEFQVNSIEIMESHLKRTGAEYEILKAAKIKNITV